jgi:hypothetical protein
MSKGMMDWLSGLAWPQITSSVGLTLDIVGVVVLIGTGLPSKKIRETAVTQLFDEAMARTYDRWAWCGAAAVVAGFVLQIVGIWLSRV